MEPEYRAGRQQQDLEYDVNSDIFPQRNLGDVVLAAKNLDDFNFALLSNVVKGWVLNDRRWCSLDIKHISDFVPNKDIFESLILPQDRTDIIKALVQSYRLGDSALTSDELKSQNDHYVAPFAADAIKGKGQGLLVLLHGPPGVGKTFTAECVAEYTKRPLFPVTCGDLGTEPRELEDNLQNCFRLAQRWQCVMLLDEADVFLARRHLSDLKRNSLVSVFLRVLEYYNGILFLTTNRVGNFDEAFTSRLHVSIHYPPLEDTERLKIWQYHMNRLERIRPDIIFSGTALNYLDSDETKKLRFNGRQIRNIFQTAVSLAVYEAETATKSQNKRPTLRSDHLKKVIKLSAEFQEYLQETRRDDSSRAYDDEIRNDNYIAREHRR
ncbi:P-loop containing nucleoside triphosphate hydrolase protein [Trichophaea hybrida]|nr:P-loop containing nucleoside triphosphate hydrolase protein [Trichophaea hybrida]